MSMKRRVQVLCVACAVLLASAAWAAGNRQLMSEKIAKQDMKRNIVEAVIGYKVLSEGQFGLTEDAEYKITQKAGALIKGIKVEKMIYDKDRDVAFCLGYIDLGDVQTVTGDRVRYKGVRVQGFGFGTTMADALQKANVLPDDCAVLELTTRKAYVTTSLVRRTGGDDVLPYPGVVIRLYPLEESSDA